MMIDMSHKISKIKKFADVFFLDNFQKTKIQKIREKNFVYTFCKKKSKNLNFQKCFNMSIHKISTKSVTFF